MIVSVALTVFISFAILYKIKFYGLSSFNVDYLSIQSTQTIKGLCALCIVACHVFGTSAESTLSVGRLFRLALAAFFFFSGYGLMYGYMNKPDYLRGFIRKRLSSLLVPLLTTAALYLPARLKAGIMPEKIIEVFTGKYLFVRYSWYVFTILLFYIVFYLIFRFVKNKTPIIILLASAMLAYPAVMYFMHYRIFWYNSFATFFIGILWCYKKESIDKLLEKHFLISFIPLIAVLAGSYVIFPLTYRLFGFYPESLGLNIRFAAVFLIIIIILTRVHIGNPVTVFLGKISYEIYLIHGLFIFSFRYVFPINNYNVKSFLVIICSVAAAWLLSILNNSIIKLIKGRDKL